jgi:hypothetical protein
VVSFTPRPLYPQGKSSWYPLDRRLGGPQSQKNEKLQINSNATVVDSDKVEPPPPHLDERFEVFTAMTIQVVVFWVVTEAARASLGHKNVAQLPLCFGGGAFLSSSLFLICKMERIHPEYGSNMILRSFGIPPHHYTASQKLPI